MAHQAAQKSATIPPPLRHGVGHLVELVNELSAPRETTGCRKGVG